MELRHLRYFLAAAEEEHFGRAAARLNIVQPALTKQMRELEDEVGAKLFLRAGRGVRLTEAGRALAREVDSVLGELAASLQRVRQINEGVTGRLRIGYVDTAMHAPALPSLFAAQRRSRPTVRLELTEATSLQQGALLASGELDVGFVYHLPPDMAHYRSRVVLRDGIVLAMPAGHRLARQRPFPGLGELKEEDFVWIARGVSPPFHDLVFRACAAAGFQPRIVQHGATDNSIMGLVAAGAGFSFTLASGMRRRPPGVVFAPIPNLRQALRLQAVWGRENTNPALSGFLHALAGKREGSQ